MIRFEYASPQTEGEAVELLNEPGVETALLAGGTDFMALMRRDLIAPRRVVDLKNVEGLRGVTREGGGLLIGALTTLEELAESRLLAPYPSLAHVVDGVRAIQVQGWGTLGGDLCLLPHCWYFRNGDGLLGLRDGQSLVEAGENRYHAILGNRGPAKFVSASRFAPTLIAWGAKVRIVGPEPDQAEILPLEYFYITPKTERQGVTVLKPGQFVSHVWLPAAGTVQSAAYEVLQMEGLDWPLAAAAACLEVEGGRVRDGRVVLGHVAPVPWVSEEAIQVLVGHEVNEDTAGRAGDAAVASATPLSKNGYKVQLARTAVKRALLRATDQLEL